MRILSWNVNGMRAVMSKANGTGLLEWLNGSGADVVGLQEVRATREQLDSEVALLESHGWHVNISAADRGGYSGVGLITRQKPDELITTLGVADFDVEGRFQYARFGDLVVVNGYFPNGNGKERDNSRIPYKLDFYKKVYDLLDADRRRGAKIVVMGDFNTAHKEIDLARPKTNTKTSGFTPVERDELDRWLTSGWIDTFRHFEKGEGHYSWWSQRFNVRAKNIGWRIDLVLASEGVLPFLRSGFILKDVMGSDHCPIGIDVDDSITSS